MPGQIGGNRPGTRPNRPGDIGGNRPDRPGSRPGSRPGNRPGDIGGNRPGRPDRPVTLPGQIGNGNNVWNNNNNNNIWNSDKWVNNNNSWNNWTNNQNNWNVNINNNWGVQGGWGGGWNNGWNGGHFGDYWYGNCVRPWHQNWYHGCWNGHWGNNWYVPLAAGLTGWAVGASTASWGYGYTYAYSNPYYVAAAEPVYDYSQPIVIYNQPAATSEAVADPNVQSEPPAAPPEPTPAEEIARQEFELAMTRFKSGDYVQSLSAVDAAIRQVADDPVMHEFRALCLFAVGQYQPAAATLNSLLAVAPGMDWTSMSSLYGNTDDYQAQLRRLQDFVRKNGDDAAARFVLAYHYLVVGEQDLALEQLEKVVELQPQDMTATRIVQALKPPVDDAEALPEPENPQPQDAAEEQPAEDAGPTTSLIGNWVTSAGKTKIELSVDEELNFVWKATTDGKTNEMTGQLATQDDAIAFETKDQGTLAGKATSLGPDQFNFLVFGAPASDKGLTFDRVK